MKRTRKDIKRYIAPEEMHERFQHVKYWPYQSNQEFLWTRDLALLCCLFGTGLRIGEAVSITKEQIDLSDVKFMVIHNVHIQKREDNIVLDIPLNRSGSFAWFTQMVIRHAAHVKKGRLFPFTTSRAWQIVNHMTGKWCHYYRSQRLSWLVNKLKNPLKAAKIVGIKRSETLDGYYVTSWREHEDEL